MIKFVLAFLLITPQIWAIDFVLNYKDLNKWAISGNGTGFSQFLAYAKQKQPTKYMVVLPKNEDTARDLSIERLRVLVQILEKSVGHGVLIQEVDINTPKTTPTNTLTFTFPQEPKK